jgi:transcriptional regulator with XRE-family HTH domain
MSGMPWEDLITPFGDVLYARIHRMGMTTGQFAERVGISRPFLSQIANRKSPPPLDRMEKWADTLELEGDERDYFLDLAALELVPERCKRLFDPRTAGFRAIQSAISRDMAASGERHPFEKWIDGKDGPASAPVPQSTADAVVHVASTSAHPRAASSLVEYRATKKRKRERS